MLQVLATTAPIFMLILLGYVCVKLKFLPAEAVPGMGKFVLYVTLPALIFNNISRLDFTEIIDPWFLLLYGAGSVLSLLFGLSVSRFILRCNLSQSALRGMGLGVSNSAFFGWPVLALVMSHPPANAFPMALIIENIVVIPLALLLIELGQSDSNSSQSDALKHALARVAKNPLIIAVLAGALGSAFKIQLPQFMNTTLEMVANASATLALIAIGGGLVGSSIRGNVRDISFVACSKLTIHPLLVALLSLVIPVSTELKLAGIILAAMPMMSMYPIIGANFGQRQLCSSILLVATLLSFVTLSILLTLLPL